MLDLSRDLRPWTVMNLVVLVIFELRNFPTGFLLEPSKQSTDVPKSRNEIIRFFFVSKIIMDLQ